MTTAHTLKTLTTSDPALTEATTHLNALDLIETIAGKSVLARYVNAADIADPPAPAWYLPDTRTAYIHIEQAGLTKAPSSISPHSTMLRREGATVLGLLTHECGHAAISGDQWESVVKAAPHHRTLITMLEELRVENYAMRRLPYTRKFLRASFGLILGNLPDTFENKGHVVRAWAITRGRTLAGVADTAETDAVDIAARTLLDDDTIDGLTDLLQEALSLTMTRPSDRARMITLCDEWVELVGELPDDGGGCTSHGDPAEGDTGSEPVEGHGTSDAGDPGAEPGGGGLDGNPDEEGDDDTDAPITDGGDSGWGTAGHDPSADSLSLGDEGLTDEDAELMAAMSRDVAKLMQAEWQRDPVVEQRSPSGVWAQKVFGDRKQSVRLTYSKPTAAARQHVVSVSNALSNLMLPTIAKTAKASTVPPGRMRSREALRASAERAGGKMVTAKPWKTTVRRHTVARPLALGVATDTSGSMRWAEKGVAEFAYVYANAGHRIGARTAAVTFGDAVHRIARPGEITDQVVFKSANDGSEHFDEAAAALDGVLHLTTPDLAARILLVVSDGAFVNSGEPDKAYAWAEAFTKAGTAVIWITDRLDDIDTPYQAWLRKAMKLPGFTVVGMSAFRAADKSVFDMLNETALAAIQKHTH